MGAVRVSGDLIGSYAYDACMILNLDTNCHFFIFREPLGANGIFRENKIWEVRIGGEFA